MESTTVIRYLSADQADSNISRQIIHPMWEAVKEEVAEALLEHRSGLLPGHIRERMRSDTREIYETLIVGLAAGYAVIKGYSPSQARTLTSVAIVRLLERHMRNGDRFEKQMSRARERLHFIAPSEPPFLSGG